MMMGYGLGGTFGWIGAGLGFIVHFAFAAIVVMAAIWLFKEIFQRSHRSNRDLDPMTILKQRYAKGEISAEEYQRIKKELE